MLQARDPLSERVHLGKPAVAGAERWPASSAARRAALGRRPRVRRRRRDACVTRGRRRTHTRAAAARLRQLVLRRHAHPAARAARGDVRDLFVLPRGRRHRRRPRPARRSGVAQLAALARRHRRALRRQPRRRRSRGLAQAVRDIRSRSARISSPSSTAWRWTSSPTSARRTARRSISIATASRARSAGCRCACSAWREDAGIALAHHLGRALQLTNILRDLDEDAAHRAALSAARGAAGGRHHARTDPRRVAGASRASRRPARRSSRARERISPRPTRSWRAARAAPCARRASWARPTRHPRRSWSRAASRRRARRCACRKRALALASCCATRSSDAAARSTSSAPGSPALPPRSACGARRARRRARGDRARRRALPLLSRPALGMTIDNGNHLLLSGNHAALDYLRSIGAERPAGRPADAPSSPSSISRAASAGRCASTTAAFRGGSSIQARACRAPARSTICRWRGCCGRRPASRSARSSRCKGPLYERLVEPLLLAALNIDPPRRLGAARRRRDPRDARARRHGLPAADRARRARARRLIEPALAFLAPARRQVRFGASAARAALCRCEPVAALDFGDGHRRARRRTTRVILAVPPYVAAALVPGLDSADRVPRHRQRAFPHRAAAGRSRRSSACSTARCEWLFAFPGRLSVTISAADRLHRRAARGAGARRSGARSRA